MIYAAEPYRLRAEGPAAFSFLIFCLDNKLFVKTPQKPGPHFGGPTRFSSLKFRGKWAILDL